MFLFDKEDLNSIRKQLSDIDLSWGSMTILEEEIGIRNSMNSYECEKRFQDLEKRIEDR
jgi:hypothetical protein